jgi:hypothetical protein
VCPGKDFVVCERATLRNHTQSIYTKEICIVSSGGIVAIREKHPNVSTGFSKLAEFHPKHYILMGAKVTHTVHARVCVC